MLELDVILRFVAAFGLVVGLIALFAFAAKRWRGVGAGRGRQGRRLEIVEAIGVDAKRRAVILRADGAEHLLLLGGGTDLLIASNPAGGFESHLAAGNRSDEA